jgi:deoxyribonuclease-4
LNEGKTVNDSVSAHLRLTTTLAALAMQGIRLNVSSFQCFFMRQGGTTLIQPEYQEIKEFLKMRERFSQLYVHGSYWINLADANCRDHYLLTRELKLAEKCGFTHMVLHPGSLKGTRCREEGIEAVARAINKAIKYHSLTIILENIAHKGSCIGGDFAELNYILQKIEQPERLLFCIDTAHAHAFGYNLVTQLDIDQFIAYIDKTIGIPQVGLIHLNDTKEMQGSGIDRHCSIGEGILGKNYSLHTLITHPQLTTFISKGMAI